MLPSKCVWLYRIHMIETKTLIQTMGLRGKPYSNCESQKCGIDYVLSGSPPPTLLTALRCIHVTPGQLTGNHKKYSKTSSGSPRWLTKSSDS